MTDFTRMLRNDARYYHFGNNSVTGTTLIKCADEIDRLNRNMDTRDTFLVENGLWSKFLEYTKEKNNEGL